MSSSNIPCTYERQVYIIIVYPCTGLYGWHYIPSIVIASRPTCNQPVLYYTKSAHHKSSIGSVSFIYVLLQTCFCVRPRYQLYSLSDWNNHTLMMLGHHLRLWININPALGHRQHDTLTPYWFNVGPLFAATGPTFGKHWANVGLSCLRCGIDNAGPT